jgi:hypothetical protein
MTTSTAKCRLGISRRTEMRVSMSAYETLSALWTPKLNHLPAILTSMKSSMFAFRHNRKICPDISLRISILVMNNFIFPKKPAQMIFHHHAML